MVDRRSVLAGAAAFAAQAGVATAAGRVDREFPAGFYWGAATAAHQVEGNNTNSDCWLMEHVQPTMFAEPSGDAANSFLLWQTDIDLVQSLNFNAYRFSLEWARIEPAPGQFSLAMLDHYKRIVDTCRERGVAPFVTFNHFTTPLWFAAQGGWHHPDSPALFARYCERAARHLGDGVSHATTLNEPNLAGLLQTVLPGNLLSGDRAMQEACARATGAAQFSPGSSIYIADPQRFRANQIAAHRAGREAIKVAHAALPVGVSLAMLDEQAIGRGAGLRDEKRELYYGEWLRATQGDDFIGVQNYERRVWGPGGLVAPPRSARRNTMGAEVFPGSLAGAVRYAHEATGLPVVVTEHGVGTDDDALRAWLIPNALSALKRAMDEGVPVLGYLHWSLIDNFEWIFGYRIHYGLCAFNRETFARTPKPSAAVLADIARRNAL